jgi:putative transposase
VRYAFIAENRLIFAVRAMCRMLLVHPSGFYAWLREPLSPRALEDQRQTVLLKQAWDDSGEVYGYRKLHDDLCDMGEDISPNRAWRLARLAGIRAQIGYKKKPGSYGGSPAVVADNTLNREFDVDAPDQFWVTDITYIRTHEGFLYLAVVIDLFSRRVIGWSMQGRAYTDLPLQALLMAVWRRKPKAKVYVHSDQGSQFTSYEWQEFLEQHNLAPSMSRRATAGTMQWWRASSTCSNASVSGAESIKPAKRPGVTCSTTSSSSTTRSANTSGMACCHRSPSNSSRN